VPPLRYEEVYQLKQDFPTLFIEINGGFLTLEQSLNQLDRVDAVMIGRAAYSEKGSTIGAGSEVLKEAMAAIPQEL
jgi:tRNA-dihydrouridine synthase A